jgi:hypothetical protein
LGSTSWNTHSGSGVVSIGGVESPVSALSGLVLSSPSSSWGSEGWTHASHPLQETARNKNKRISSNLPAALQS